MRKLKPLVLLTSFLLSGISVANSQNLADVENELARAGFEQVIFLAVGQRDQVSLFKLGLEHRSMNNPLDIIRLASFICNKYGFEPLGFTLFRKGQVIHESHVESNESISTQYLSDAYVRDFNRLFSLKKYRLNTYLTPDVKVRFGYYENPIQTKADLIWGSEMVLFRGLSLFSGVSIPLTNDLDTQDLSLSLAPTYLEYFSQIIDGHFIQVSTGTFFNNRYGLDYQYRFMSPNKSWGMGLRYAYSGFYFYPSNRVYFANPDNQLVLVDFEYFFPKQRISLLIQVGQYLDSDQGAKVELFKQYRNIELGFFSSLTKTGSNAGFKIMLPLLPNKIIRTRAFEFRTDEAFRWEYAYSNEGRIAGGFKAGMLLSDRLRRYNSNLFNHF